MMYPLPDREVCRAFTALCWEVNSPVSHRARRALENKDWVALTTIKVVVPHYCSARFLSGDLQVAAFWKKYPGFDLGIDLEAKAVRSFHSSEAECYHSNERLSPLLHDLGHYGGSIERIIRSARKKVKDCLGRVPKISELDARFGPGSTYGDVGPYITVPDKMSSRCTLTKSASPALQHWDTLAWSRYAASGLETSYPASPSADYMGGPTLVPSDLDHAPRPEQYVEGNRFTTVPKDAWKLRGICIEPSLNLFYQLGVGDWISKRMKWHFGWDKSTQQDFHKLLARLGSLTGLSATIDLSNASDTVCRNLVQLLLPPKWYSLLDMLRSKKTCIAGKWYHLEKFSSMGNGFTFELETLLFRVLAEVACEGTPPLDFLGGVITTFGDDIIVPTSGVSNVLALLKFCGFSINKDKTFVDGRFRESCGGDYFDGLDVRPHYQKDVVDEPHQIIACANGLRRFGIRHILCGGPNVHIKPWLRILDSLPSDIRRLRGPEELGDLLIHDEESKWTFTVRQSQRYFRVWRPVPVRRRGWEHFRPGVVLASALYGCGDGRAVPIPGMSPYQQVRLADQGGVLTRVSGSYVSGFRFGRVSYS